MALPEGYSVEVVMETPPRAKLTITTAKGAGSDMQHQVVMLMGSMGCRDMAEKLLKTAQILEASNG